MTKKHSNKYWYSKFVRAVKSGLNRQKRKWSFGQHKPMAFPAGAAASCTHQSAFTRLKLEAFSSTWPLRKKNSIYKRKSAHWHFFPGAWTHWETATTLRFYCEMPLWIVLLTQSRLVLSKIIKRVDARGGAIIPNKRDNNPKAEPSRLRRSGRFDFRGLCGQPPQRSHRLCFALLTGWNTIFYFRCVRTTSVSASSLHVPPSST